MSNAEVKAQYLRVLIEKVRQDRYPSATHMALIEQTIPRQWIPEYLEVMLEKVANDPRPSITMLHRIRRLAEAAR